MVLIGECYKAGGLRGIDTVWSPTTDSKRLNRDDFLSLGNGRDRRDPTHLPKFSQSL